MEWNKLEEYIVNRLYMLENQLADAKREIERLDNLNAEVTQLVYYLGKNSKFERLGGKPYLNVQMIAVTDENRELLSILNARNMEVLEDE